MPIEHIVDGNWIPIKNPALRTFTYVNPSGRRFNILVELGKPGNAKGGQLSNQQIARAEWYEWLNADVPFHVEVISVSQPRGILDLGFAVEPDGSLVFVVLTDMGDGNVNTQQKQFLHSTAQVRDL